LRRYPLTKDGTRNTLNLAREEEEVDMLSAKIDLLMKKFDEHTTEKNEVTHIHDSRMTCEECGGTGHSGSNCPEIQEDVNYIYNNFNNRPQ
jgi:hypothetical protein